MRERERADIRTDTERRVGRERENMEEEGGPHHIIIGPDYHVMLDIDSYDKQGIERLHFYTG